MREYHKIQTIYKRDNVTKKLIPYEFTDDTARYLALNEWVFTEKVDGTNIRIYWDGHKVTFAGRTDNAQIPAHLVNRLNDLFGGEENAQLFEQKFGEMPVILYGEGYGPKIQGVGAKYRDDVDFILFDVMVGEMYLKRSDVENIAEYFSIDVVPILCQGTLYSGIEYVQTHRESTIAKNGAPLEGVVGRPCVEVLDRRGKRVIVKIKCCDFPPEEWE